MQKNEYSLIESWLKYHGYLFGYENLVVIDNGSTSQIVLDILQKFENVGVKIVREYSTSAHFDVKGHCVAEVIRRWDSGPQYDFAIPLDCDEFIGLWQDGKISCSRNEILDYFDGLRGLKGCCVAETDLFNIPNDPGWYWPQNGTKCFFAAKSIAALDRGFHVGKSKFGSDVVRTNITHFHFHHKPYQQYVSCVREKLKTLVNVDNRDDLESYTSPGGHLLRNLLDGEKKYLDKFTNYLRIHLPEFGELISILGVEQELFRVTQESKSLPPFVIATTSDPANRAVNFILFDGEAYRRRWNDVATNGFDPLLHYVRFGKSEGRDVR